MNPIVKITSAQLIAQVAKDTGFPVAHVRSIVNSYLNHIEKEVCKGHRVLIGSFGQFYRWNVAGRRSLGPFRKNNGRYMAFRPCGRLTGI